MVKLHSNSLTIVAGNVCARYDLADIEVIEQQGRKIKIITYYEECEFYEKMDNVTSLLIGTAFYRAMKGMVINFDTVISISNSEIFFRSGHRLSMGRNNFVKVRQAYKRYLMTYPQFAHMDMYVSDRTTNVQKF